MKAKGSLTTAPTLSFFDLNKPTRLCTNASRQGLGFILQQRSKDSTWTLVQAGSHFLSAAESRYATVELEMLVVCWATLKCKIFLSGLQHFTVITDHNPCSQSSIRIAWMRLKILDYNDLKPGSWPTISLLSGARAARTMPQMPSHVVQHLTHYQQKYSQKSMPSIIRRCPLQSYERTPVTTQCIPLNHLCRTAEQDEEYQMLKGFILNGFLPIAINYQNHVESTGMSGSISRWMTTSLSMDAIY